MSDIQGPIPPIHARARAFSNIQPFTYEDGITFMELLERLRDYIENTLVPFIHDGLQIFADEVIAELQTRLDAVIALLDEATDLVNQAEALRDDVQVIHDAVVVLRDQVIQLANDANASAVRAEAAAQLAEDMRDQVQEMMSRLVFPQTFGAVGNGVADDSAAWNAFQASTSGIRFVLPGRYKVNGEIKRFNFGVFGNGEFKDAGSSWDQARGDHERHSILVHRNVIDAMDEPVSPVIKTQTEVNWEESNPAAASFKHVVGAYHEAILNGYYAITTDTNQNITVSGTTGKNNMAGLFGMLGHLSYIEDATEQEQPMITNMGATKNGAQFLRFTRRSRYDSGGYMFGQEIYAMNAANEPNDVPYQNNNEFAFNAWTSGIKIGAFSTGAPISAAMFTHGSTTSKHGFWNGLVIGGSGFRINHEVEGVPGTVGINLASWRAGAGYGDVGIRMRRANRHMWFAEGAKIRSEHTRFMNHGGGAGVSIESATGSAPYLRFRDGARDDADGGNVNDLAVIDANADRVQVRSVGEVHLSAVSGGAVYVGNSARFAPGTANDGQLDLGSGTRRWQNVYATSGAITTSDERAKTDIADIPDDVLDSWGDVGFTQYRMRDAVSVKGSDARLHSGLIAQRIVNAFSAHGLNAMDYGIVCYESWDYEPEKVNEIKSLIRPAEYEQVLVKEAEFTEHHNEDGSVEVIESMPAEYKDGKVIREPEYDIIREVTPEVASGDRYSVRYEEALAMEAAYQRRRADRLDERLTRLEGLIS